MASFIRSAHLSVVPYRTPVVLLDSTSSSSRAVSKNRKRYELDGFDLDLSFINCCELKERVLAMGFPAEGKEAWYRNSFKEVRRFLEYKNDNSGTYKVYNLALEKTPYDPEKLGGFSASYGFEDHQVPSLEQMQAFCRDLDNFLGQHPQNFAAVHCKAGKGRTGVMICAYLLHKGYVAHAKDAMETYGRQRSKNASGVTVPSQQRYLHYFEAAVADKRIPEAAPLSLDAVHISGLPVRQLANLVVSISCRLPSASVTHVISQAASSQDAIKTHQATRYTEATPAAELRLSPGSASSGCLIQGDVRVEVFQGKASKKQLLFRTWFNTAFISAGSYTLRDWELDKGAGAVKAGTLLRMLLSEKPESTTAEQSREVPGVAREEGLSGNLPLAYSPVCGTIPAGHLPGVQTPSPTAHIFDVHPDFSIPSTFCMSPSAPPPTPPFTPLTGLFTGSSTQLPETPGTLEMSRTSSPVRELSERLELLARDDTLDVPNRLTANRRTLSSPFPEASRAALKELLLAPPATLSQVRTRPEGWLKDPELFDLSAPTTPSLPRPINAFDWRHSPLIPEQQYIVSQRRSANNADLIADRDAFQEGTASGPDSPSHGARLIKWMSASWWLDMA